MFTWCGTFPVLGSAHHRTLCQLHWARLWRRAGTEPFDQLERQVLLGRKTAHQLLMRRFILLDELMVCVEHPPLPFLSSLGQCAGCSLFIPALSHGFERVGRGAALRPNFENWKMRSACKWYKNAS